MSPNRRTEWAIAQDKILSTVLPRTQKRIIRATTNITASTATIQFRLDARVKTLNPKQQQKTHITKAKAHWQHLNLSIDLSLLPPLTINTHSPLPTTASPDDVISSERHQSQHHQQQQRQRSPTTPDTGDTRWVTARNIFTRAHPTIQDLISEALFHDTGVQRLAVLFGRRAALQEEWRYLARIRRGYYARFMRGGQCAEVEGVLAGEEGRVRLERWVGRAEGRVGELAVDLGAVYLELRERVGRWEDREGEEEGGNDEEEEEDVGGFWGGGDGLAGRVEGGYVDSDTEYFEDVDDEVSIGELGDTY